MGTTFQLPKMDEEVYVTNALNRSKAWAGKFVHRENNLAAEGHRDVTRFMRDYDTQVSNTMSPQDKLEVLSIAEALKAAMSQKANR